MCGDGKESYRSGKEDIPRPRTAEELLKRKKQHVRETEPMDFIRETMR
jgi:hypothetical protein